MTTVEPPAGAAPGASPVRGWQVRRLRDTAAALHLEPVPAEPVRAVWVLEATAPALVLGSTQRDDVVDRTAAARRRIDVARRRSGGGAVLVDRTTAWVDVVVPSGDRLWDDDVGRAAHWVGAAWRAALADLGVAPTQVHTAGLACGPLGRLVCFGTVGAGEVTTPDGRKVVGVSQRRTRRAARFQCAVYSHWSPEPLTDLLRIHPQGSAALADAAIGTGRSPAEMVDAFVRHLPD